MILAQTRAGVAQRRSIAGAVCRPSEAAAGEFEVFVNGGSAETPSPRVGLRYFRARPGPSPSAALAVGHVFVPRAPRRRHAALAGSLASAMGEHVDFLSEFLRDPISTGSVVPSSSSLAREVVAGLDLAGAAVVVEAGPGTGAFTGAILEACGEQTRVLAIEVNADFTARLGRRFPGVSVVHDSVERLPERLRDAGLGPADVVVSGLPWAVLGPERQARLLYGIAGGLRSGGWFATFGYVHCAPLPGARRFRRLLDGEFGEAGHSPVVWRNLPPAVVYRYRRR
jgi:phospholipid N-methyltransferase